MTFHGFREPREQAFLRRNLSVDDHFNKVNQFLNLLFIGRIFKFCLLTQLLKVWIVIDCCSVGCSNYRAISCPNIVNIALTLFGFFSALLGLSNIERFYFFLTFLEV